MSGKFACLRPKNNRRKEAGHINCKYNMISIKTPAGFMQKSTKFPSSCGSTEHGERPKRLDAEPSRGTAPSRCLQLLLRSAVRRES